MSRGERSRHFPWAASFYAALFTVFVLTESRHSRRVPADLLPNLPPFISRVGSGYAPFRGDLLTGVSPSRIERRAESFPFSALASLVALARTALLAPVWFRQGRRRKQGRML